MKRFFVFILRLYQKILSPDTGLVSVFFVMPVCRHNPSCSEYTIRCIQKYGVFLGIFKGVKQFLLCNPLTKKA